MLLDQQHIERVDDLNVSVKGPPRVFLIAKEISLMIAARVPSAAA